MLKYSLVLFLLLFFQLSLHNCIRNSSSGNDNDRIKIKRPEPDTTQNPYILTEGGYPDWSPTGDKLAFIRDNYLWVYNFVTNEEERILKNATDPSFSSDGQKIAFERDRTIWVVDLNTYAETYLCEGITPSWSENGKWIAFGHKDASKTTTDADLIQGQPSPDKSLYYYDLLGKSIESIVVTNWDSLWIGIESSMFSPDWVQDDSLVVFSNEITIYLVSLKGGRARRLFNPYLLPKPAGFSFVRQPMWCQVNQRLSYTLYTPRHSENDPITNIRLGFITMDSTGTVSFSATHYSDTAWGPIGDKVAFFTKENIKIVRWKELL